MIFPELPLILSRISYRTCTIHAVLYIIILPINQCPGTDDGNLKLSSKCSNMYSNKYAPKIKRKKVPTTNNPIERFFIFIL